MPYTSDPAATSWCGTVRSKPTTTPSPSTPMIIPPRTPSSGGLKTDSSRTARTSMTPSTAPRAFSRASSPEAGGIGNPAWTSSPPATQWFPAGASTAATAPKSKRITRPPAGRITKREPSPTLTASPGPCRRTPTSAIVAGCGMWFSAISGCRKNATSHSACTSTTTSSRAATTRTRRSLSKATSFSNGYRWKMRFPPSSRAARRWTASSCATPASATAKS